MTDLVNTIRNMYGFKQFNEEKIERYRVHYKVDGKEFHGTTEASSTKEASKKTINGRKNVEIISSKLADPTIKEESLNEDIFENQRKHAKNLLMDAGYKQTSENTFEHPKHGHKAEFKHTLPHPFVIHFSTKRPDGHVATIEHPFMTSHMIHAMKEYE